MRFVKGNPGGPGRQMSETSASLSDIDRRRDQKLRYVFGITIAEYYELHKKQSGVCAICGRPETKMLHGVITNLSVDHDHETGKVRGLLCYRCNTGIGKLRDSADLLRKAADYLDENPDSR